MSKMNHYRSSIPKAAQERIVSTHESNGNKMRVEYLLNGEIVGFRWFAEDGMAGTENPLKNGLLHGTQYYFDVRSDGTFTASSAWPFREGKPHGVARQWSEEGNLIGTFEMKHGTGWDLWRNRHYESSAHYLSEARHLQDGNWHGFEWWLGEDQKSVHQEAHFWENLQHGIRRMWNHQGKLKRGYPQYWVKNERVTKRQYRRAQARDPNLPPYRESDNVPLRDFPPEVLAAIQETANLKLGARSYSRTLIPSAFIFRYK